MEFVAPEIFTALNEPCHIQEIRKAFEIITAVTTENCWTSARVDSIKITIESMPDEIMPKLEQNELK